MDNDPERTTTISHAASGGGYNEVFGGVGVAVTDDDERGLTLSRESLSLTEATGTGRTASYKVALTSEPTSKVTVNLSPNSEGRSEGVSLFPRIHLRELADRAKPSPLQAVDDDIDNDVARATTIAHRLHTASGGDYGSVTGSVAVTVTDDDDRGLTISEDSVKVTEAAGDSRTASYTVALASQPTATVTVSLSSGDEDAATVSPATLTFTTNDWSAAQSVTVTAVDDEILTDRDAYPRKTTITHTTSGGDYGEETGSVAVTVVEDEGTPTFSIANAEVAEGDEGTSDLTFTVTLSPAAGYRTQVRWSTSDDTATAGTDYTAAYGGLLFRPGETTKTFTVKVIGDLVTEDDETLNVSLSDAGYWVGLFFVRSLNIGQGLNVGQGTATGKIIDDDPEPTVSLALSPTSISENGGSSTVTAELSGKSSAAVTVDVAATTASGTGTYTLSTNKRLTIPAGATASTGTVTITATNNDVDAPNTTGDGGGGRRTAGPSPIRPRRR